MSMLTRLGKFQENNLVRGCETNPILCPIVSGLGNFAIGVIRTFGYIFNAAMNGINKHILKNQGYTNKPTNFKSSISQLGWGILMAIPIIGREIALVRLGMVNNEHQNKIAKLEQDVLTLKGSSNNFSDIRSPNDLVNEEANIGFLNNR